MSIVVSEEAVEQVSKIFIELLKVYFSELTNTSVDFGKPYLEKDNIEYGDYVGVIHISGLCNGFICITATSSSLNSLIESVFHKSIADPNMVKDVLGEMANTIAGNARSLYGENFVISLPKVFSKNGYKMDFKKVPIVLPFLWKNHKYNLILWFSKSLQDSHAGFSEVLR
jgi:chemotaxis protein CheX